MDLIAAHKLYKQIAFNIMPAEGIRQFRKELADRHADIASLRSEACETSDSILESGQEAATGKNWAESFLKILPPTA
jgi:hypothetical protein